MVFYDTHAHLDYPDYAADFEQVLERAQAAGIRKMISIGTDLESSGRAIALAEKHDAIFAAVGWHPSYAKDAPEDIRSDLREMARHPKVVALGETGLDYSRLPSKESGNPGDDLPEKEKQRRIFRQHLEVAAEAGLNCVIHQRDSFADTLAEMVPFAGRTRGVFHCFVESPEMGARVREIGCLISFTGILTFKNGKTVRDTLASTPLDQFMLETDCPYLAPAPYRGKRCEPAHVADIARVAAETKGCTLEELNRATCKTAEEFFPRLRNA